MSVVCARGSLFQWLSYYMRVCQPASQPVCVFVCMSVSFSVYAQRSRNMKQEKKSHTMSAANIEKWHLPVSSTRTHTHNQRRLTLHTSVHQRSARSLARSHSQNPHAVHTQFICAVACFSLSPILYLLHSHLCMADVGFVYKTLSFFLFIAFRISISNS